MKENKVNNLQIAKKAKDDEFYTLYEDIEKELQHYKHFLKGKIIYCPCDNPEWSNFYKYFSANFESLGIKKLITTFYAEKSFKRELTAEGYVEYELLGNGDFRSLECVETMKESDIIITNPPFSLFRDFIDQLEGLGKQFLILGNMNAISYKNVFKLIKENKLWLGVNYGCMYFRVPDDKEIRTKNYRIVEVEE